MLVRFSHGTQCCRAKKHLSKGLKQTHESLGNLGFIVNTRSSGEKCDEFAARGWSIVMMGVRNLI